MTVNTRPYAYIPGIARQKLPEWTGKKWYHQRFDGCPYFLHLIAEAEIVYHEERKPGFDFSVHYYFFEDSKADCYIAMDDIVKVYTAVIEAGKTNPNLSSDLIALWKKDEERFYEKCMDLAKVHFKKLTKEQLMQLHDHFVEICLNKNSSSSIIDGFALGTDEMIAAKIKEIYEQHPIKERMRFAEVFSILTAPVHLSFINDAEVALLRTAQEIKKHPKKKKELLEKHQKEFFWTRNNYVDDNVLSVKYFEKEVKKLLSMKLDLAKEIERVENTPCENKRKKELLMREFVLDDHMRFMLKVSEDFTYWQDERKKGTFWTTHYASIILKEISRRTKIPLDELKYMSPREVSTIFQKKPDRKILKQRKKNSVFCYYKEGHECVYGKECDEVKRTIIGTTDLSDVDDFRGLTACTGKAIGRVKIVKSAKEIDKVEKGDIIVAVMTRPDYVPAMKRAAAIVTDEGGVTCHAAIVARELGIPCIIATKIATKVLKDNMMVEVNANHSWVKILR